MLGTFGLMISFFLILTYIEFLEKKAGLSRKYRWTRAIGSMVFFTCLTIYSYLKQAEGVKKLRCSAAFFCRLFSFGKGERIVNLKLALEKLNLNDRQVDLDELIKKMLHQIGSTDPVLRDELIYSTFSKLVMRDFLNEEQLTHLLNVCLDQEHLFYQIGERETDSVFTRSFSALVIALVVEKDRSSQFLKKEQMEAATEGCIRYLQEEQDTRGFVASKGWAHSIAHGADALAGVIKHPLFDREKSVECLNVIQECLFKEGTYVDDEDERLLFAIEALLEKGMKEETLSKWLTSLSDNLESLFEVERYSVEFFHKKGNVLSFLKSCYFRLLIRDTCSDARRVMEDVVEKWTRKIYLGD